MLKRTIIAVLALSLCAAGSANAQVATDGDTRAAKPASIWFHPLPTTADWPGGTEIGGSVDFPDLFQTNAPWPIAMAHVSVFGIYAGWILDATDEELQQTVAFLNAHNMGIEIEAPALQAISTCGSGVEGYVPYGDSVHDVTLAYLDRLKALGAQVPFVKVDEPYFYANVVNEPHACHWPVSKIASEVGAYARLVRSVYPKAAVGDVEPIIASAYTPDVKTALDDWHDTYRSVTGKPFPFFFADIDFSNPEWPAIVKSIEYKTRHHGMRFGIIYIGDEPDTSDAEWSGKAVARFETYQLDNAGHPDYVLFQSWQPYPQYCLPENDPTTFTGVIDAYINDFD
jgi:hypothetical protein